MLRKQLTLPAALLAVLPIAAASQPSSNAELEQVQATIESGRQTAGEALGRAQALLDGGRVISKEMRQAGDIQAAPPGSLDGVRPQAHGIDLDELLAGHGRIDAMPRLSGDQVLVFVSASVPASSLRRLARQAAAIGAPLVLRGVVGGDFDATARFMREVLGEEEPRAKAIIDPTLFSHFGVEQVPAVVLAPDGVCTAGVTRCPEETPAHVHVAGDVTLDYTLDYVASVHPEHRATAGALLARLGGGQ